MDIIYGGAAIKAASCDHRHIPSLTHVLGCKVSQNREQLSLFVQQSDARQFLQDIDLTARVAAVFCIPSTHQTIQIKGLDARREPFDQKDLSVVDKATQAFAADILALGFSTDYSATANHFGIEDLVTVVFTPSAIFEQTPGPNAGNPLEFAL